MKVSTRLLSAVLAALLSVVFCIPAFAAPKDENTTAAAAAETTAESATPADTTAGTAAGDNAKADNSVIQEILASYSNPNGRTLSIAKDGNPRIYPEASMQSIQCAADQGSDIVSVKVQKTKDGKLVLLNDSTIDRMLITKSGKAAKGKVSSYTLEDLQNKFVLRQGHGGTKKGRSSESVAELGTVLTTCKSKVMIYISNGWKYAADINSIARETGTYNIVIIGEATSAESIKKFVSQQGTPICHIASYFNADTAKGSAKTFAVDTLDAGADAVMLAAEKDTSPIFKSSVLSKFKDKGRAMISATSTNLCGGYTDSNSGWESIIESGYNVIETDYPEELAVHIDEIEAYRSILTSIITQAQSLHKSNYNSSTFNVMEGRLKDAENIASTGAVSLNAVDSSRYLLQESIDALNTGVELKSDHALPGFVKFLFVILAILALFGLVILGLRLFNKHKKTHRKENKRMRKLKKQSEENLKNARTVDDGVDFTISTEGSSNNIVSKLAGKKAAEGAAAVKKAADKTPAVEIINQSDDVVPEAPVDTIHADTADAAMDSIADSADADAGKLADSVDDSVIENRL